MTCNTAHRFQRGAAIDASLFGAAALAQRQNKAPSQRGCGRQPVRRSARRLWALEERLHQFGAVEGALSKHALHLARSKDVVRTVGETSYFSTFYNAVQPSCVLGSSGRGLSAVVFA